jgi:carboxymethylenebutenolidase
LVAGRRSIIISFISRLHHHLLSHAEDYTFKDKDVETAKAIFKEQEGKPNHVEYEFRTWKGKVFVLVARASARLIQSVNALGTAHGFAVRPNLTVPEVKAGYEGGLEQTVAWFKKTL